MINPELIQSVKVLNKLYNSADNYPHIVLDNFVDPTIIKDVEVEAKVLTQDYENHAFRFKGESDEHASQVHKRGINEYPNMPHSMNLLCRYFNNPEFINFLRELTGIEDLVPDWDLNGGGFHVTYPGGSLNIHHDFNYTDKMGPERMYRKVNLLVYLNEEWEEEWTGNLELWKSDVSEQFKSIFPKFNRAVLFNIEDAPHGHPHPLACPSNENRRSLAFYYYSKQPNNNRLYDRAHWKVGNELL
jgi:Rps23 Pro-64 3,4-dihydroxylase Tpa1-like proline 4-hydroxylase